MSINEPSITINETNFINVHKSGFIIVYKLHTKSKIMKLFFQKSKNQIHVKGSQSLYTPSDFVLMPRYSPFVNTPYRRNMGFSVFPI